jgi:GlpG protein
MRRLDDLRNDAEADAIGDVLLAMGIDHQIDLNADRPPTLWVVRDEDMTMAEQTLQAFREDPSHFDGARRDASKQRRLQDNQTKSEEARQRQTERLAQPISFGLVTPALIALSIGLTLLGAPGVTGLNNPEAIYWAQVDSFTQPGLVPDILSGQVWRLLTPAFVHGGLMHLGFNMWWMWDLGRMVESRKGPVYLILFTVALILATVLGQYFVGMWLFSTGISPDGSIGPLYIGGPNAIGMSGVIYGLFGYLWAKSRLDPFSGIGVSSTTVAFMVLWFIICFTGSAGNIANIAHAAGLLVGVLWGAVSHRIRKTW